MPKTEEALRAEVEALRARVAELERVEVERTRSDIRLQQTRDHLQAVLDAIPACVTWIGSDRRYRGMNKYFGALAGISGESFYGKPVGFRGSDTIFSDFVTEFFQSTAQHATTLTQTPTERGIRQFLICAQKYAGGDEAVFVGLDVTERNDFERALEKSEERYRRLFEDSLLGIFQFSVDGKILSINPAFVRMFGYESADELIADEGGLASALHDGPDERDWIARLIGEERDSLELQDRFRRKDGSVFNGTLHAWIARGPDTETQYVEGFVEDVSERKELEDQLRQAQKMEAVGRVVGGVAHDFNNALTSIIGNLTLSLRKGTRLGEAEHAGRALKSAQQAAELVRQLLTFSRKTRANTALVDLNKIAKNSHALVRQTIDRRIDVTLQLDENVPQVLGDAAQIDSVLMNLCVNARDAITEVILGRAAPERKNDRFDIRLRTECRTLTERASESDANARPGRFVVLSVSDNGMGIDLDTQRQIFEPFFTTKPEEQGTGLGLASAYGIVNQHDGWIHLVSERGKGTTFEVYLPVAEQVPKPVENQDGVDFPEGSETLLLVEDEDAIRSLNREMLEECGYTVLEAVDGKEGLEVHREERDHIDLIVLDLSMPNLSGMEFMEQLRGAHEETRVLVSSGYAGKQEKGYLKPFDIVGFVDKPYQIHELAQGVRAALDAPQES